MISSNIIYVNYVYIIYTIYYLNYVHIKKHLFIAFSFFKYSSLENTIPETLLGGLWKQNSFRIITILKRYFPVSLSFPFEYTVGFSRRIMICDNISLMVNEMCVFVLLYFLECSKVLGVNMCFFSEISSICSQYFCFTLTCYNLTFA